MVIDRLRKWISLIPASTKDTAEDTARQMIANVIKIQGVPHDFIVDRNSTWTSHFWTEFSKCLRLDMKMTTARHQQANGLAENAVKSIKNLLTNLASLESKEWFDALPLIKFTYNTTPHTSTGYLPFEMTYGVTANTITDQSMKHFQVPAVEEMKTNIDKIMKDVRQKLDTMQNQQKKFYNKNRRNTILNIDDLVLVHKDGFTKMISKDYTHPYLGPFKIIEILPNDNY